MKIFGIIICIFLISCGEQGASKAGYLIVKGRINDKMVASVSQDLSRVHNIIITSQGGNTSSAIDLARLIYDNKVSVSVEGYCLSACAQYILPAAKSVEFIGTPILGVHQSPTSVRNFFRYQNIEIGDKNMILAQKEEEFFKHINLTLNLAIEPIHYLDIICFGTKNGDPSVGSKWGFFVPAPQTYKYWIGKPYVGQYAYSKQEIVSSFNKYLPKNFSTTMILEYEANRKEFAKVAECPPPHPQ